MLCKPSFPSPHCQAVDVESDTVYLQLTHNFGIVGDCDMTIYDATNGKEILDIGTLESSGAQSEVYSLEPIIKKRAERVKWASYYYVYTAPANTPAPSFSVADYAFIMIKKKKRVTVYDGYSTYIDYYLPGTKKNYDDGNLVLLKIERDITINNIVVGISHEVAYTDPESNNTEALVESIEVLPYSTGILSTFPAYPSSLILARLQPGVLQNGRDYIWNATLYETDNVLCNIVTNYGSLMENTSYNSTTRTATLTLRPDTSLASYFNSYGSGDGKILDAKKKFYINIGSGSYLINTYKMIADSSTGATNLYTSAKATVRLEESDSWSENTPYTVTCNFVQSDNYIFYARSNPEITISMDGVVITPGEENKFSLESVKAKFTGTYFQAENITMSGYEVILYEVSSAGLKEILHTKTKNSFQIDFEYNRFISGITYAVMFRVIDSYGRYTESGLYYISPGYSQTPAGYVPSIEFLDNTSSVMIDWSETKSIAPDNIPENGVQDILISDDGESSVFTEAGTDSIRNGIILSDGANLEWSKINGKSELEISSDNEYIWEGFVDSTYEGKIIELSGDDGLVSYIRFENDCFYIKPWFSTESEYMTYSYEINMLSTPENISEKEKIRFVWDEGSEWVEGDDYKENSQGAGYWWRIMVTPDSYEVTRLSKTGRVVTANG